MIKKRIIKKYKFSVENFIHDSRSVGILLLFFTIVSIVVTNLDGIGEMYNSFWHLEIPFFHHFSLPHSILHFINDALMAIFFFQVGMEIKREALIGELSSPSRMIMPAIAAIFGVIVPAFMFSILTKGTDYHAGWAIPTATDIAFCLGVVSLLGKSVPSSLKVFLTALAIIDDLCAILIIAMFYGDQISMLWLGGVVVVALLVIFNFKFLPLKVSKIIFPILGLIMWYCMYQSGIHATFAGVILAFLLPMDYLETLEKEMHFSVNYLIIPIFAMANTSIFINSEAVMGLTSTLSLGIILGLCIGKPLGISLGLFILSRIKTFKSKMKINWMQMIGGGILAGIGFTMSIFVSTLSFEDAKLVDISKLSVLIASLFSMFVGYVWLRIASRKRSKKKFI